MEGKYRTRSSALESVATEQKQKYQPLIIVRRPRVGLPGLEPPITLSKNILEHLIK